MRRSAPKPFTLRDVAALANVSIATVSAVVNNKPTVSMDSKRRVEDVMRRLDYMPDTLARSLKTGRSHAIGLVVPDVTNPFFTDLMAGVEEVARALGYSVTLSNSNEDSEQELRNVCFLHTRRVDGILLSCASGGSFLDAAALRRCPVVVVDRLPAAGFSGSAVTVDNFEGARLAVRHLLELGHRRIAVIAGRLDLSVGAERLAGFQAAMQDANLPVQSAFVQSGDFHPDSGYQCGLRLLNLPERPTAIFACNNSMTLGLMRALSERNIDCPAQMSIIAFDEFQWAAYFRPRLTTVAQPVYELGRQAANVLVSLLESDGQEASELKTKRVILRPELRVRESTSAPRL